MTVIAVPPRHLSRKSPGPVRHLRPGPRRGDIPSDGDGWRRHTEGDGGPLRGDGELCESPGYDGSGTDCERGTTCTQS